MAVLSVIDNRLIFKRKIEPFNQALELVGHDSVKTLNDVLTNSSACEMLANNEAARGIMKYNYAAEMTAYIDSNWNDGLNLLNYKCKLKCYLYKAGNTCDAVSGGWTVKWANVLAGAPMGCSTNNNGTIYMYFKRTNGDGLYRDKCDAYTGNSIDASGFSSINWTITKISSKGKKQFMYGDSYYHEGVTTAKTHIFDAKSGIQKFRWDNVPHENVGEQECRISNIWLEPTEDEIDVTTSDLDSAVLDSMTLA